MRTITAAQEVLLSNGTRATHLRVFVHRGGSDWVNLCDLQDRDWVESVSYGGDIDNDCDTARIDLFLKQDEWNLAPLVDGSALNAGGALARPGRAVYIEVAIVPEGVTPASGDWIEVFRGRINRVDWARTLVLHCRDQMGDLIDRFIETQQKYPKDPATSDDMENIAQAILDDHIGGVTLYSMTGSSGTPFEATDSPGWVINEYIQKKQSIAEALQILAEQAAGQIRYRWNNNDNSFRLTFWQPDRGKRAQGKSNLSMNPGNGGTFVVNTTTFTWRDTPTLDTDIQRGATAQETAQNAVATINAKLGSELTCYNSPPDVGFLAAFIVEWKAVGTAGNSVPFLTGTLGDYVAGEDAGTTVRTFSADDYHEISNLSIDQGPVRNRVRVVYGRFQEDRTPVTVEDPVSQALFGIRFMEIAEDASSQIDTPDEAITMANAALDDLKDVKAIKSVTMPYFPWVEPGDYYRFAANGHHYDTDQDLAVVSWQHTLSRNECRTTLQCRGTPAGGVLRWLSKEAQRVRQETDFYSDAAPSNAAGIPGLGSIIIQYDDPRGMSPPINDWAFSRVYLSTTNGFTPSPSNEEYVGRETRVVIDGLVPGTTYYAVVEHIDAAGNVSARTSQITTATERSGPYHENGEREGGPINPNPNFAVFTKDETTNPPDGWEISVGAWGTGEGQFYFESSKILSGNRALKWISDSDTSSNPTKRIMSDWFPIEGDALYRISVTFARGNDGAVDVFAYSLSLGYQLDDEDKNASPSISYPSSRWWPTGSMSELEWSTTDWYRADGWLIPGSNMRYMRLMVEIDPDLTARQQPSYYVDRIFVTRDLARLLVNRGAAGATNRSASSSTWTTLWLNTTTIHGDSAEDNTGGWTSGDAVNIQTHRYTIPFDGYYEITGVVRFAGASTTTFFIARILANGSTVLSTGVPAQRVTGGVGGLVVWRGLLSAGTYVQLQGWHNEGDILFFNETECEFYVNQLPERKD